MIARTHLKICRKNVGALIALDPTHPPTDLRVGWFRPTRLGPKGIFIGFLDQHDVFNLVHIRLREEQVVLVKALKESQLLERADP